MPLGAALPFLGLIPLASTVFEHDDRNATALTVCTAETGLHALGQEYAQALSGLQRVCDGGGGGGAH